MAYNKRRQLGYNKKWIEEDTARKEGCDGNIFTNDNKLTTFQDKNDDETSEEEEALKQVFMKRRNLGKKGSAITVTINYVSVSFTDPNAFVFHYKVRIDPEPNQLKLCRKVFEITEAERFPNSTCAFDGRRNLYTRKPISASRRDTRISEIVNMFSEQSTFNTIKRFSDIENWLPTLFQYQSSSYKECKSITGKISAIYTVSVWDEEFLAKRSFKIYAQLNEILRYDEMSDATQSSSGVSPKVVEALETIVGENALKKYFCF